MKCAKVSDTWKLRISYSVLFICAFEAIFWFTPLLTAASPVVVSPLERSEALQFYTAAQTIFFSDEPVSFHQQRHLLAVEAQVAAAQQHQAFLDLKHIAKEQQYTSSSHKSGVPLLGALALAAGTALFLSARGSGTASVSDRGGGGSSRRRSVTKRATDALADPTTAAIAGSVVGGAVVAGAAVALARRGRFASSSSAAATAASKATTSLFTAPSSSSSRIAAFGALSRSEPSMSSTSGAHQQRAPSAKMMAPAAEPMMRSNMPTTVIVSSSSSHHHQRDNNHHQAAPVVAAAVVDARECAPETACAPSAADRAASAKLSAKLTPAQLQALSDDELVELVRGGVLPAYALENSLGDLVRAVRVRRMSISRDGRLDNLPFEHYDYANVIGACAENVLGYVPVPVGVAGPVMMDGELIHIPMATTEGCLIASTHRGCKAITESGGAITVVHSDGMTRAPSVRMPSAARAGELMAWLNTPGASETLREAFQSTTRFGKLLDVEGHMAGRTVYIRFRAQTGDAMGMNMISKGVECALDALLAVFPDADVLALSGNLCTDKKPSAINWIQGRGKSVVAEASIVEKVLKTTVDDLIELNISKNLVGSAMAGSVGGFNAHASNVVTAMYIATGQDPAQNVESSNCLTFMEKHGEDLRISVTMPSIECASIGGGTHLPAQSSALDLMGCKGAHREQPGANAQKFARAVATATLAGELSLMSALCAGHLVRAHMVHNRKK